MPIARKSDLEFLQHPFQDCTAPKQFSQDWFHWKNAFNSDGRNIEETIALGEWNRNFREWSVDQLRVRRADILQHIDCAFVVPHHAPEHDVFSTSHWNFPQALAWIATRDPKQVARITYGEHWHAPISEEVLSRYLRQNRIMRRKLIGRLLLVVSNHHCKCGSKPKEDSEPWESCQCLFNAYEELRIFADKKGWTAPPYRAEPSIGNFELDWADDSHKIVLPRGDVQKQWPSIQKHPAPRRQNVSIGALKEWYSKLQNRDSLTQDERLNAAKSNFPRNNVPRQMLRDIIGEIDGPQKPGKKPSAGSFGRNSGG